MSFGTKSKGDDATSAWANLIEDALGDGNPAQGASYIVFYDSGDSEFKARNGLDGTIDANGTDEATVIQAAIDAMSPTGGIVSLFPSGASWTIDSTIQLKPRTRLLGQVQATKAGMGTYFVANCDPVIQATLIGTETRIDEAEVANITFIEAADAKAKVAIDLTLARYSVIRQCYIRGFSEGIYITNGGFYNTIRDCHINTCATGIQITDATANANSNTIIGGQVENCTTAGIDFVGSNDNAAIRVGLESNAIGWQSNAGAHHKLMGCRVESNTIGLKFLGAQTSNIIHDNYFTGNTAEINGTPGAGSRIFANSLFLTERHGTGTITNPATSATITHGLGGAASKLTPSLEDIHIIGGENPTNAITAIWVDTIGDTTFQVNMEPAPGASHWDFGWHVKMLW